MELADVRPIPSTDALIELLAQGARHHDTLVVAGSEPVDLLAHALQCAHEVALARPDDVELQLAALVHDIGHQLVPSDDPAHDAMHGLAGAVAVRSLLGDRVARLVAYHVPAKRFLVTVDPDYRHTLSAVSVHTLEHQGGLLTTDEAERYAQLPDWPAALTLRYADDAAKQHGRRVPDLAHWHRVLDRPRVTPAG